MVSQYYSPPRIGAGFTDLYYYDSIRLKILFTKYYNDFTLS
jgi:hypothetical protein